MTKKTQESAKEFEEFHQSRKQLKQQSPDFSIIKSYILNVLKIDGVAFNQIESWISKPINMVMSNERTLSLPLETLVGLLNTKILKPITVSEIQAYLTKARK